VVESLDDDTLELRYLKSPPLLFGTVLRFAGGLCHVSLGAIRNAFAEFQDKITDVCYGAPDRIAPHPVR